MTQILSELSGLVLCKDDVQGFGVPEYSMETKEGVKPPFWSYKRKMKLKPEEVVKLFLEDNGYLVMGEEGLLVRAFYSLMCLVAYEENENGPMVTTTRSGVEKISIKPCFIESPNSAFTRNHICSVLRKGSIESIIEYIECFGRIVHWKGPRGFLPDEIKLLREFLSAFGVDSLLTMFEVASKEISGLSGWPDIVAIKNNSVSFVEVKTTDQLTKRQKDWLSMYKRKLGIEYSIIRLKKMN